MREIAAHAALLAMAFGCRAIAARMMVTKLDALMGVVTNGLGSLPSVRNPTKQRPSKIRQLLCVAIAARQEERQCSIRKCRHIPLPCIRTYDVRQPAIVNNKLVADFKQSRRRHKPCANIAKRVKIIPRFD